MHAACLTEHVGSIISHSCCVSHLILLPLYKKTAEQVKSDAQLSPWIDWLCFTSPHPSHHLIHPHLASQPFRIVTDYPPLPSAGWHCASVISSSIYICYINDHGSINYWDRRQSAPKCYPEGEIGTSVIPSLFVDTDCLALSRRRLCDNKKNIWILNVHSGPPGWNSVEINTGKISCVKTQFGLVCIV